MRARKNKQVGFDTSFDSFLSIVTKNGLGMLILVAMASTFANMQTLGQAKFKRSLGTPLVSDAPDNLKPVFLECRGDAVYPMDMEAVQPDIQQIFGFGQVANAQAMRQLNAQNKMTEFHLLEFQADLSGNLQVHFKPRPGKAGFGSGDLKGPFADYLRRRCDPRQKFLVFCVKPDSFRIYREVAAFAREMGYQIGWEPHTADEPNVIYHGFNLGKQKLG